MEEVKDTSLKAYENQEFSYEELVEEVNVIRDLSRNPLFDVMLVMQNNEKAQLTLSGTEAEQVQVSHTISKFDLTFQIEEVGAEILLNQ